MSLSPTEILAIISVILTLSVGIIAIIILQQKRLFNYQKHNYEILQESEERYRRLVNYSPVAMAVFLSEKIVYINDVGAKLLGVDHDTVNNIEIRSLVHDKTITDIKRKIILNKQRGLETAIIDTQLILRSNDFKDIEVTAIPIIYDGKDAYQVVVRDVTERKRYEAELISAKEKAEQSDKLKDAFIANISHEIRTPLNVILGYSNLILSEFKDRLKEEEANFFESIERGGQRLMRTVEHILNISSIQVGTFSLHSEAIDVNSRTAKLIQDLHSIASERNLTLDFLSDIANAFIDADRYCFDQALINLIDNALKFTNQGGVRVRVYRQDTRICIDVTDTGIGIAADYLPKVFNVFSQEISGYSRPFEGLGLGLALTKKYIEMNSGSITVKSRKGIGTTFTLHFLAKDPQKDFNEIPGDRSERQLTHKSTIVHRVGNRNILVVEDDEQTQEYMRILLKKEYNIYLASSGKEAWSILTTSQIELILLDLSLRGDEDGLQFARRIRLSAEYNTIPIIVLTAHAFPEDKSKSLAAGCDLYLAKPFQINELKQALKNFLVENYKS